MTQHPLKRRWPSFAGCAVAMLAVAGLARAEPSRRPVPDRPAQEAAAKVVNEVYQARFEQARTAGQRRSLVRNLVDESRRSEADRAARYVLLREAGRWAVEARDARLAVDAAAELASVFDIDGFALKRQAVEAVARRATAFPERVGLAAVLWDVLGEAVARDDYQAARPLAIALREAVEAIHDPAAAELAAARATEIDTLAAEYAAVAKALAVLESKPADPEANLASGRFYALRKGDWEKGLSMLALGTNVQWRALATRDLRLPAEPEPQAALGDAWWEAARKSEEELPRRHLRARAAFWYRRAAPGLPGGLLKARIERRLEETPPEGPFQPRPRPLPVEGVVVQAGYGIDRTWNDATQVVREAVARDPFAPVQGDSRALGDPAPGRNKELAVTFRIGRQTATLQLPEGTPGLVPPVSPQGVKLPTASREPSIVAARYGAGLTWLDVTDALAERLAETRQPVKTGFDLAGQDPWFGVDKRTVVWFDYQGKRYVRLLKEGEVFVPAL